MEEEEGEGDPGHPQRQYPEGGGEEAAQPARGEVRLGGVVAVDERRDEDPTGVVDI